MRASYQRAIQWLANNDDNDWLDDLEPSASVCACLVADLFGKDTSVVIHDLKREIKKQSVSTPPHKLPDA